jgi:hypothetical protein
LTDELQNSTMLSATFYYQKSFVLYISLFTHISEIRKRVMLASEKGITNKQFCRNPLATASDARLAIVMHVNLEC